MKKLTTTLLILVLASCSSIDGDYLGGAVQVRTGDGPSNNANEDAYDNTSESLDPYMDIDESRFEGVPWREGTISFLYESDVDTAFMKIKNEYEYYTEAEVMREYGAVVGEWKLLDQSYIYEAVPGVFYKMMDRRNHQFNGVTRRHNIYFEIKKNGNNSQINIMFWVKDPDIVSLSDYGKSLKDRTINALQK